MRDYINLDVRWSKPEEAPMYIQMPIHIYANMPIVKYLEERYSQKVLGWTVSTRKHDDLLPLEKLIHVLNVHATDDEVYMIWYLTCGTLVKRYPKLMGNVYAACYERIVDAMGKKAFLCLEETTTPEDIELFKLSNVNWMIVNEYFAEAGVSI